MPHRKLLPVYMGLARGIGAYFGERLSVQQLASDRVRIAFAAQQPGPRA